MEKIKTSKNLRFLREKWCPGAESNHRHADFQSAALPTELPGHLKLAGIRPVSFYRSQERRPHSYDTNVLTALEALATLDLKSIKKNLIEPQKTYDHNQASVDAILVLIVSYRKQP